MLRYEIFSRERELEILSGPSNFIYFNNINGRRILFLGEQHKETQEYKSIKNQNVDEWLYNLSRDNNVDVFLEFNNNNNTFLNNFYERYIIKRKNTQIINIFTRLTDCFFNGNLHNIDIRNQSMIIMQMKNLKSTEFTAFCTFSFF